MDFFERKGTLTSDKKLPGVVGQQESESTALSSDQEVAPKIMTMEELYAMRSETIPQLLYVPFDALLFFGKEIKTICISVALGEMSHARDLLNSVLSATSNGEQTQAQAEQSTSLLSATLVSKPSSIVSVQAFNTQLTIGSKDEALRKAARLFKAEADTMERNRLKGEKYWVDALRIRRANWGLSPSPLPPGSAVGKGSDKTSKDFMISYGLETCGFLYFASLS